MSSENEYVSKQTLLIAIAASLVIGFLSGVVYSVYNAPSPSPTAAVQQTQPQNDQASQLQAAITSLELETQKNPDNGQAWVQLGHAYFDSDMPAKAIMAYTKSLDLLPGDVNVMTDLGVMYRRNGQPDMAIAILNEVLQIDPNHEQAMFNKGVVQLYDLKDKESALVTWRQLVAVNQFAAAPDGTLVTEIVDKVAAQPEPQ